VTVENRLLKCEVGAFDYRTVRQRMAKKRSTSQRERLKTPTGTYFAKRTAGGQFKELDEVGRSLAADVGEWRRRLRRQATAIREMGNTSRENLRA
jgi:hypothetical protein